MSDMSSTQMARDPEAIRMFILRGAVQELRLYDEITNATGAEAVKWKKLRRKMGGLPTRTSTKKVLKIVDTHVFADRLDEVLSAEDRAVIARVRAAVEVTQ